jgi:hypothetical protein
MPAGRYRLLGDDGAVAGTESFRSAPGPAGWRYVGEFDSRDPAPRRGTVDVVADAGWRIARIRVQLTDHTLLLEAREGVLVGELDGEAIAIDFAPELDVDYLTTATNVTAARRLRGEGELVVAYIDPITLVPEPLRQRYSLLAPQDDVLTPVGLFRAERWRYEDESGFSADLWLAGDAVVAYEGLFELEAYEPGATGTIPTP